MPYSDLTQVGQYAGYMKPLYERHDEVPRKPFTAEADESVHDPITEIYDKTSPMDFVGSLPISCAGAMDPELARTETSLFSPPEDHDLYHMQEPAHKKHKLSSATQVIETRQSGSGSSSYIPVPNHVSNKSGVYSQYSGRQRDL